MKFLQVTLSPSHTQRSLLLPPLLFAMPSSSNRPASPHSPVIPTSSVASTTLHRHRRHSRSRRPFSFPFTSNSHHPSPPTLFLLPLFCLTMTNLTPPLLTTDACRRPPLVARLLARSPDSTTTSPPLFISLILEIE